VKKRKKEKEMAVTERLSLAARLLPKGRSPWLVSGIC